MTLSEVFVIGGIMKNILLLTSFHFSDAMSCIIPIFIGLMLIFNWFLPHPANKPNPKWVKILCTLIGAALVALGVIILIDFIHNPYK